LSVKDCRGKQGGASDLAGRHELGEHMLATFDGFNFFMLTVNKISLRVISLGSIVRLQSPCSDCTMLDWSLAFGMAFRRMLIRTFQYVVRRLKLHHECS
jgi:hypothetical protein